MSIRFFTSTLLLIAAILARVNPQTAVRSYYIKKDFFNGIKAGEFSILDPTSKELQYRVESRYSLMQSVELVAYPSKQVVGKLNKNFKVLHYTGTISILDSSSNQWIDGTIKEEFAGQFMIDWNGQRVTMGNRFGPRNSDFRDEKQGTLFAQYRVKINSLFAAYRYELQLFSDKLPDAIYFLALAAKDHQETQAEAMWISGWKKRYTHE